MKLKDFKSVFKDMNVEIIVEDMERTKIMCYTSAMSLYPDLVVLHIDLTPRMPLIVLGGVENG